MSDGSRPTARRQTFAAWLGAALVAIASLSPPAGRADQAAAGSAGEPPYAASVNPNNIAPTVATAPHDSVVVFGKPRVASGHPNTIWDEEDIRHYRDMLNSSRELRFLFLKLKEGLDARIARPVDIPPPERGPEGAWLYPGDYFPPFPGEPGGDSAVQRFSRYLERDATAICQLGLLYALSGEEKYARYARDLLLAYANLPRYGASPSINYRWAKGLTNQVLEDALDLELIARGYDLISNSPTLSQDDRRRVHDDLLQPLASVILYPEAVERDIGASFASQVNNRGAIGAAAVLLAGYAADDNELVNAALYGTRATVPTPDQLHYKQFPPPKDWVAATPSNPSHGLLTVHFAPAAIAGGMWVEGSPAYDLYALAAMVNAAEAAWRHGIDLYSANHAILKSMFDFPLLFAYPDMSDPSENDSGRLRLPSGYFPALYEYGYRRYRDPRYLPVIFPAEERASGDRNPDPAGARSLSYRWLPSAPPSFLFDSDPNGEAALKRLDSDRDEAPRKLLPNVNFPAVGYGVLRVPASDGSGVVNLTLSYGPAASHGHPDKLHIDLWAHDDIAAPSPGVIYPYDNPLDQKWYWTTLAHNTLTVDEKNQLYYPQPAAHADQTVYGPAKTVGVERAWSDSVYPGVALDRALFVTDGYVADLFAAFSRAPHRYDLAWHLRGAASTDLPLAPGPFPDPVPNGYNAFQDVRRAPPTSASWSMSVDLKGRVARLVAAGGAPTEPILAEGAPPYDGVPTPTIIERRDAIDATLFGTVLDLSSDAAGAVKAVSEQGGLDRGYGLLQIERADGVDLCFASYRPGLYSAAGVETDALQALAQMIGSSPRALYLGGGTTLKVGEAAISRSAEGLAYIESAPGGGYLVGNPSPTPATVSVKLKALEGLEAFEIDDDGRPKARADAVNNGAGEFSLRLGAASRVAFVPQGKF